eukprot:m.47166 g.47166  ORF g.47166 m.47166 type:complete len:210 (+) comp10745_c0_seq1:80-709(+)
MGDRVVLQLQSWRNARRKWEQVEAVSLGVASAYCNDLNALRSAWSKRSEEETLTECIGRTKKTINSGQRNINTTSSISSLHKSAVAKRKELRALIEQQEATLKRMSAISSLLIKEWRQAQLRGCATNNGNGDKINEETPVCRVDVHSTALLQLYKEELGVKKTAFEQLCKEDERDVQLVLLSLWLHQPLLSLGGDVHTDALDRYFDIIK